MFWHAWRWFEHFYGGDNASGPWYLWWSGFFGDVTIFVGVFAIAHKHNCHVKGCKRIVRTHMDHSIGRYACVRHHTKGELHGTPPV